MVMEDRQSNIPSPSKLTTPQYNIHTSQAVTKSWKHTTQESPAHNHPYIGHHHPYTVTFTHHHHPYTVTHTSPSPLYCHPHITITPILSPLNHHCDSTCTHRKAIFYMSHSFILAGYKFTVGPTSTLYKFCRYTCNFRDLQ